jgi:signal transduction histidine kinase
MSMDRIEAISLLTGKSSEDRIRAARYLTRHGISEDAQTIETILRSETNKWAKSALKRALSAIRKDPIPTKVSTGAEDEEERGVEQIAADAIEDTTQRLVHELRPVLGRLDLYASKDIAGYEESRIKAEWTRLRDLLDAIEKLGQAAATPTFAEFNFVDLLERVVQSEIQGTEIPVEVAGTKPFVILGDAALLDIILSNGVRNALEATKESASTDPIVINWGETDRDYWMSVLDRGVGFPKGFSKVFEIGATTKKGHTGMGLALARQAAKSLSGEITLSPREPHGAKFEFRWPHVTQ